METITSHSPKASNPVISFEGPPIACSISIASRGEQGRNGWTKEQRNNARIKFTLWFQLDLYVRITIYNFLPKIVQGKQLGGILNILSYDLLARRGSKDSKDAWIDASFCSISLESVEYFSQWNVFFDCWPQFCKCQSCTVSSFFDRFQTSVGTTILCTIDRRPLHFSSDKSPNDAYPDSTECTKSWDCFVPGRSGPVDFDKFGTSSRFPTSESPDMFSDCRSECPKDRFSIRTIGHQQQWFGVSFFDCTHKAERQVVIVVHPLTSGFFDWECGGWVVCVCTV
jgi:hypothetical protein